MMPMEMNLDDLKREETFNLSFPSRPERFEAWAKKFPGMPPVIINQRHAIVFGIDWYDHLREKKVEAINVLKIRLTDKEALFLNYQLKDCFFGCNLYEKLMFLKKIIVMADIREIQENTELGFPINPEILEKLELLSGPEFRDLLAGDRVNLKTVLRISQFEKKDRRPLIRLFEQARFSLSNQFRLMDMIQEIVFRDKISVRRLFSNLNLAEYLSLEKLDEKIMSDIFRCRFPAYHETEKEWKNEVKKLQLPAGFTVNHTEFFEKKGIQLNISLDSLEALKDLVEKLKK